MKALVSWDEQTEQGKGLTADSDLAFRQTSFQLLAATENQTGKNY